jgi:threonine/homoserine/homoserine lactone efflux protein
MFELPIFLRGLVLGLLIAAPVGPIGVLCIKRTLTHGRLSGFFSGLGAATADAFYGAVAAFGLTVISGFLLKHHYGLQLTGGLFLLYIGIRSFKSKPKDTTFQKSSSSLISDYFSTLFLTITNPMTIISFGALFLGIGFMNQDYKLATTLVTGVFVGSVLWWFILSSSICWLKTKVKNFSLSIINRISGIVIVCFALIILASLLF